MTCNEIKELTVPYLELDLEPSRVRDVTTHLEGCAGCRVEMEAVRQVLVRVKGMEVPDPGDWFWKQFPERVRQELARARPPGPVRRWKAAAGWPMALAASVLLFVGGWSLKGMLDKELVPAPPLPRAVVEAPQTRGAQPPTAVFDRPQLAEADWQEFWDEDHDTVAEMASRLDRRVVDRLFGDI